MCMCVGRVSCSSCSGGSSDGFSTAPLSPPPIKVEFRHAGVVTDSPKTRGGQMQTETFVDAVAEKNVKTIAVGIWPVARCPSL